RACRNVRQLRARNNEILDVAEIDEEIECSVEVGMAGDIVARLIEIRARQHTTSASHDEDGRSWFLDNSTIAVTGALSISIGPPASDASSAISYLIPSVVPC